MRMTQVPVIDLLDIALVLMQSNCDKDALDFFLDLLPENMSDDYIEEFFKEKIIFKGQEQKMLALFKILREMLIERGQWGCSWLPEKWL